MRFYRLFIYLILASFFLNNYFTAEAMDHRIDMNMENSKSEYVKIAKEFMTSNGLDKDWNINKPSLYYENDTEISFKFRTRHPFAMDLKYAVPYIVVINKNSRQVFANGPAK